MIAHAVVAGVEAGLALGRARRRAGQPARLNSTPLAGLVLTVMAALLVVVSPLRAAEPTPVSVQTAPGRFDISAVDATMAHAVAASAEEAWRVLAGPLGLPEAFNSPIFARIVTPENPAAPTSFRVMVEPGGVVSVQLALQRGVDAVARRGLVQALLMRLGVSRHGVTERLAAPLWLEQACVGWWQTRAEAAQLDALKHASRAMSPPSLDALLGWQRGGTEPREFAIGAIWLLTFLQIETGKGREWPVLLQRLLAGDEPLAALAAAFPDRFTDAAERELWWSTGYHHARRMRTLPALESVESRMQLGVLTRFVFAASETADRALPLIGVHAHAAEPLVAAELARRAGEVDRLVPALHPFYRNAGLALAEALRSGGKDLARRTALCTAFDQDWRDAVELENASRAALDTLENRAR